MADPEETEAERYWRLAEMAREIPGGYGEIVDAFEDLARKSADAESGS